MTTKLRMLSFLCFPHFSAIVKKGHLQFENMIRTSTMETYDLSFYIFMGALISQCGILIAFFCILCWLSRPRVAGLNDIEPNQREIQTHWSKHTSDISPLIQDHILHQQKCS
jgi:hypothetical protein